MADITPEWFHLLPYGYAPGSYMNRCISCGNVVSELDKRATRCKPCAVSAADNAALRAELEQAMKERARALSVGDDMEQETERLRERVKVLEDALRGLLSGEDAESTLESYATASEAARAALKATP